ncbi:MAG: AAA family ATPase, partial [Bradymonadaceae bacterium]
MSENFAPDDKCALIRIAAPDPETLSALEAAAHRRGAAAVDRTLRHLEASFSRPLAALRFGVYAGGNQTPLRIGVHFGRPLASDHPEAARGPAARILGRLADLAEPGQLLMTDAFFSQLASAGQTAFDARCREFGQYRLRPGGRLYRLHILADESATADQPIQLGETNLDRRSREFVGRGKLLSQLGGELRRHRIVTLTGPAGIGKSRAAREFLRRHHTRHPGADTWVVELADADSLQNVVDAIAATVGVSLARRDDDPLVALGHALAARSDCVVVLDGVDPVTSQVAVCLQTLLPMTPSARWLVTARQPLNLVPELEIEVPGVPPDDAALLFQDCLDRTGRQFELDEQNLETVLELVQTVGGSPLAIELASHCALVSPLETALDRLKTRQDRAPETSTVELLVDCLLEELDDSERQLLRACAVAPASFPIVIARQLVDPDDDRIDAHFSALRARGLLRIVPGPGSDEQLHVEIPQTIAEALDRRCPVDDRLVERWVAHFVKWLVDDIGEPPWIRTAPMFDGLAHQRDNLAFAAEYGIEHGHDRAVIPLLALYTLVEGRRGPNVLAVKLLERATGERAEVFEETKLVALQTVHSHLHTLAGNHERAAEIADEAVEHVDLEAYPDQATLAHLARAHPRRTSEEEDPYTPAEAVAEEASPHARACVGLYQARWRLERGDPSGAESYLEEAFDELTDDCSQLAARLERVAGEHAAASCHFRKANDHLQRALALFRRLDYDREIGATLRMLGRVAHDIGEADRAISFLQENLSVARRTGRARAAARSLGELGGMAFKRQAFGPARERLESFCDGPIHEYDDARDDPAADATSRLSAHLKYGTLGPRETYAATRPAMAAADSEADEAGVEEFRQQLA